MVSGEPSLRMLNAKVLRHEIFSGKSRPAPASAVLEGAIIAELRSNNVLHFISIWVSIASTVTIFQKYFIGYRKVQIKIIIN